MTQKNTIPGVLTSPRANTKVPDIGANILFDFDARDITVANGAAVTSWASKGSLTGWTLLQSIVTSQPTFDTSIASTGAKGVNFTAPNQFLQTSLDATDATMPLTVMALVRLRDVTTSRYVFSGGNVDGTQRYLQGSVASSQYGSAVLTATGASTLSGAPATANAFSTVIWSFAGTTAESSIWVDGIKQASKTFSDADLTKAYLPRLTIGASAGGGTTRLEGWVCRFTGAGKVYTDAEAALWNSRRRADHIP